MRHADPEIRVRPATPDDCAPVASLYGGYVRDSLSNFDLVAPTPWDWQEKLSGLEEVGLPFLVAVAGEELVGYALATPWRSRPGYRFAVEDSIYVDPAWVRRGIGRKLMAELIERLRLWGAKQVIAVVADSGELASPALHLGAGFTEVGRLRQVGFKQGRWVDTRLLQLSLDDQSDESDPTRSFE